MENLQKATSAKAKKLNRKLGKYELITRIAVGGMAEVFLARQMGYHNFRKLVVVKAVHPHLTKEREFIQMLLDEARISALLKHPRVVDIYDLGLEDDTYFIAMEYLAGQPLTEIIKTGLRARKLDIYSTIRIMADVADGLHAAHNLQALTGEPLELVHRDVSPGNIIVLYDGNVKLVDFGISKARGRLHQTGMTKAKGKIGYAAPEQVRGGRVDRRTDIFSLGVCMWETLTHKRLFAADSQHSVLAKMDAGNVPPPSIYRHETPPEIDELVLRALQIDPKDRFQSAAELQRELEVFLRAANYYRESNAIADYMDDMFSARRRQQQELIRNASEPTKQLQLTDQAALANRPDFGMEDDENSDVLTSAKDGVNGSSNAPRPILETRSLLRGEDMTRLETPIAPADDAVTAPRRVAPPIPNRGDTVRTQLPPIPTGDPDRAKTEVDDQHFDVGDISDVTDVEEIDDSADIGAIVAAQHSGDTTQVVEPLPDPDDKPRKTLWLLGVVVLIAAAVAAWIAMSGSDLDKTDSETTGPSASNDTKADKDSADEDGDDADKPPPLDPETEALLDDSDEEQAEEEAERAELEAQKAAEEKARAEAETKAAEAARAEQQARAKAEADAKALAKEQARLEAEQLAKQQAEEEAEAKAKAKAEAEAKAKAEKAKKAKAAKKPKGPSKKELRTQARAAYKAGIKLYVAGKMSAAKRKFREALKLRPGYASPHRGLGLVFEREGNKAAAIREFRKYLKMFPRAKDAPTIESRIKRLGG